MVLNEARQAVLRFLLESDVSESGSRLGTEEILDIAALAHGFINHPYWARISRMLASTEKAEMETLLDPTSDAGHQALSRASVAMIRKLLAMPHVDIAQGAAAVKVVEQHEALHGETRWTGAHKGVPQPRGA